MAWNTVSRASVRLVKKTQRDSSRLLVKPEAILGPVTSSRSGEMFPEGQVKIIV